MRKVHLLGNPPHSDHPPNLHHLLLQLHLHLQVLLCWLLLLLLQTHPALLLLLLQTDPALLHLLLQNHPALQPRLLKHQVVLQLEQELCQRAALAPKPLFAAVLLHQLHCCCCQAGRLPAAV
jgi:hypothetical protein